MTSSCAKRCAATLSSTTSSAYIQRYAIFLRLPLSGSVACNHVSTRAGQDPPPVRAFFLAIAGGGGPVNLVLLGAITMSSRFVAAAFISQVLLALSTAIAATLSVAADEI